jgi:hypothetical protein
VGTAQDRNASRRKIAIDENSGTLGVGVIFILSNLLPFLCFKTF